MTLQDFSSELTGALLAAKHVVLIAHKSPDGDALGSLAGMRRLILENYTHIRVSVVVPPEKVSDEHITWVLSDSVDQIPSDADLVIVLDTALLSRTALDPADYPTVRTMAIDHHEVQPENLPGFTDAGAPSATVILTELAQILSWKILPETATALLLGIYTDTGGFIHRNSNQRAFSAAGHLISLGADQSRITTEAFGNYSLEYLHELGSGLLSIVQKGNVACLYFHETPHNAHLKSHIIGFLSGIKNVDIACVLMQKNGEVKGSFRTRREHIDVNTMAQKLGGGGHKKAAGFTLTGNIDGNTLHWENKSFSPEEFIDFITTLTENA